MKMRLFIFSILTMLSVLTYGQDNSDTVEYADYYIVSVSEGKDFISLKDAEVRASQITNLETNELGRIYRSEKGIIVPEVCDDEMYCGEYYPRRPFYEDNFLSIEMKYAYGEKEVDLLEMMVMGGIFSDEREAEQMVNKLKPEFPNVRYFKATLFLGCMH